MKFRYIFGQFFLVVLGSRKKKFAVPVGLFFFFLGGELDSFFFQILGGEGGGGRERHPESVFFQNCRSSTKK